MVLHDTLLLVIIKIIVGVIAIIVYKIKLQKKKPINCGNNFPNRFILILNRRFAFNDCL